MWWHEDLLRRSSLTGKSPDEIFANHKISSGDLEWARSPEEIFARTTVMEDLFRRSSMAEPENQRRIFSAHRRFRTNPAPVQIQSPSTSPRLQQQTRIPTRSCLKKKPARPTDRPSCGRPDVHAWFSKLICIVCIAGGFLCKGWAGGMSRKH